MNPWPKVWCVTDSTYFRGPVLKKYYLYVCVPTGRILKDMYKNAIPGDASVAVEVFFLIFLCWVCTTFEMQANEKKPSERNYMSWT